MPSVVQGVLIAVLACSLATLHPSWSESALCIAFVQEPVTVLTIPESAQPLTLTETLRMHPLWGSPERILSQAQPVLAGQLAGPETVVGDAEGRHLFFLEQPIGRITQWTRGADDELLVVHDVGGCPLGGGVDVEGNLIYCDCAKGLMMVEAATKSVRFLTDSVSDDSPLEPGTRIGFADDLHIASDGKVYFSDATSHSCTYQPSQKHYNVMPAAHFSSLQGATGRLLVWEPSTRKTHVLATGLYFANGVALSAREDFVVVAATYSAQLHRYWLKGPKAGTLEKFADLGGAPDGLSRGPDGSFWVAIPAQLPDVFVSATKSRLVRRLFAMLPEALLPAPVKMGMVAQLSPEGKVLRVLQDPEGETVHLVTSVNAIGDRLYIGNLHDTCAHVLPLKE